MNAAPSPAVIAAAGWRANQRLLGWVAVLGWWPVAAAASVSPGYTGSFLSWFTYVDAGLWAAAALGWWLLRRRASRLDEATTRRAGRLVTRRLSPVRVIGVAVLALAVPILVQQSVNAAAAATGSGSRSSFVATSSQLSSYRSGVSYYRGRWGQDHQAWLMDEQPATGESVKIWVPPFGGREVWAGATGSTVYSIGYVALLGAVCWIMRRWARPRRQRGRLLVRRA